MTALKSEGVVIAISDAASGESPSSFVTIGSITDFTGPGGSATVIDCTTLESAAKEKIMGLADEGQLSLGLNLDPANEGQRHCFAARSAQEKRDFTLTLTDTAGTVLSFAGFVLEFSDSGAVDDKISASIVIEITGAVTGFPAPT